MKIREVILEAVQDARDKVTTAKGIIATKIKELPEDEATLRALQEIEDLLTQVSAGGRSGYINKKLEEIDDEAVTKSRKILARYIHSIAVNYEPKLREELFSMWKGDKIVNIDRLLSKKVHSFGEIFNGYNQNPLIKEFIDDVMEEQSLGQGRGEFGLNVLSKRITKPGTHVVNLPDDDKEEKQKGDLLINGRKIEVKTTFGGAARFTDQDVAPAEGYEQAAADLKQFVRNINVSTSATGLNGKQALEIGQSLKDDNTLGPQFFSLVQNVIEKIFGGPKADKKMVNKIMTAFKAGDVNNFLQNYSQASLLYYLGQKEDEGVLAINLNSKNFVFYQNAEDLASVSQRLKADTFYLTNIKDKRMAYPQLEVVPTTFGANAAKLAKKQNVQAYTQAIPQAQTPVELEQDLQTMVSDLADINNITNPNQINDMIVAASEWLSKQKNKTTISQDSLIDFLKNRNLLTPVPDELDVMVKNAGIPSPAASTVPGQTQ